MPLSSWVNVSTGLFFTGASLLIGLLVVAWKLGAVANGMNRAADNAAKLNGQLQTVTDSIDVQRAGSMPDNIEKITDDMEQITETVVSLEDVDDSVDNIEAAITAVDLKGIEEAVERLFTDSFGEDSLPIGNSVHYTLDESGIEVAISLAAMDEHATQVNFRFDKEIRTGAITDLLANDEELGQLEDRLFGEQSSIAVPSPRQLNFTVPTSDMDAITEWVPKMVDRMDDYILQTTESANEFDERVAEALKNNKGP